MLLQFVTKLDNVSDDIKTLSLVRAGVTFREEGGGRWREEGGARAKSTEYWTSLLYTHHHTGTPLTFESFKAVILTSAHSTSPGGYLHVCSCSYIVEDSFVGNRVPPCYHCPKLSVLTNSLKTYQLKPRVQKHCQTKLVKPQGVFAQTREAIISCLSTETIIICLSSSFSSVSMLLFTTFTIYSTMKPFSSILHFVTIVAVLSVIRLYIGSIALREEQWRLGMRLQTNGIGIKNWE